MKAKHHFFSSLAVGGALYAATASSAALAGAMIGGFLIDADHAIDQLWSIASGAPYLKQRFTTDEPGGSRGFLARYVRRRKLTRLPLIFHSYELMAALVVLTLMARTPLMIGLLAGYMLHIALDMYRHHHEFRSPFFYLIAYRLTRGFRRDRLIKPEYL